LLVAEMQPLDSLSDLHSGLACGLLAKRHELGYVKRQKLIHMEG
jgi:hypothetical protein